MSSYRRHYLPSISRSDVKGGVRLIQPYSVTDYFLIFRVHNLLTSAADSLITRPPSFLYTCKYRFSRGVQMNPLLNTPRIIMVRLYQVQCANECKVYCYPYSQNPLFSMIFTFLYTVSLIRVIMRTAYTGVLYNDNAGGHYGYR